MVFYTSPHAWGPSLASRTEFEENLVQETVDKIASAKLECEGYLRVLPANMDQFLMCIQLSLHHNASPRLTPFRGQAATPEAPKDDASAYSKPGYAFPPGHILSIEIKLAEVQRLPFPSELKVWLVAHAPLAL